MIRSKYVILTAIAVGASTGSFYLAKLHGQTDAASPRHLPSYSGSTAFPGNATPETALQSLGWAAAQGDLDLLQDSVTPEIQKMLHDHGGRNMKAHTLGVAAQLATAKILHKEVTSDGQILLEVQPEGKETHWKVRMQKSGENWKLAELVP